MVVLALFSLISLNSFAEDIPPVLSVDYSSQVKGKKLELIKDTAGPKIEVPAKVVAKPPVSLPDDTKKVAEEESKPSEPNPENKVAIDPQLKKDTSDVMGLFMSFGESLSKKEVDSVLKKSSDNFIFITTNQTSINTKEMLVTYFNGKNNPLGDLTSTAFDEALTVSLSKDNTWGTVLGKGVEKYNIASKEFSVPIRWSATIEKVEEEWKIKSFHSGVNFLENDIFSSNQEFGYKLLAIGLFVGILAGLIGGLVLSRIAKKDQE